MYGDINDAVEPDMKLFWGLAFQAKASRCKGPKARADSLCGQSGVEKGWKWSQREVGRGVHTRPQNSAATQGLHTY